MDESFEAGKVSKECEDLTLDQIHYLIAISAFRNIEKKHSVVIRVRSNNILLTGDNDNVITQALQAIKDVPGHREETQLSLETLKAIQKINVNTIFKELNKLKVRAGWLADMEKESLFVYSGSREMVDKAKSVLCNVVNEFEAATPDIVKFLKCVGTPEKLKKNFGIGISFSGDNGDLKMAFSGPDDSKKKAREEIKRCEVMNNWKQRWVELEPNLLQIIRTTTHAEVVQRLKAAGAKAGWHVDLTKRRLLTYGSDCDAAKAIDIIRDMSRHVRQGSGVRQSRPLSEMNPRGPTFPNRGPSDQRNTTNHQQFQQPRFRGPHQPPFRNQNPRMFDQRNAPTQSPCRPQGYRPRMNMRPPYNSSQPTLPNVRPGENCKYNESLSDVELEKIRYLSALKIQQQLESQFNVRIKIEAQSSLVKVSGNSADQVLDAKAKVIDQLRAAVIQPCSNKPQHFMHSLRNVPNKQVVAALISAQVRAGWDIRNGSLMICCDSRPIFSKAEDAIYSLVADGVYPDGGCLEKEQLDTLNQPTWAEYIKKLSSTYQTFQWKLEEELSRIVFAVCESDSMAVKHSLNTFFGTFRSKESKHTIMAQDAPILRSNLEEVKAALQPRGGKSVEIIEITDTQCTLVSESVESLKYAREQLQKLSNNIKTIPISIRRKAQIDWVNSAEGSDRIEAISNRTTTSITCNLQGQGADRGIPVMASVASRMKVVIGDIADIASRGDAGGIFSSQGVIAKAIKGKFQDFMEISGVSNLILDKKSTVWVYHSKLPDRSSDHSHLKHLGKEIAMAMQQFSEAQLKKVAFPAVGTGNLGYSPNEVSETIIDAVQNFLQINQQCSIQEVYLVVFKSSEQIHHDFKKKLTDLTTVTPGQSGSVGTLMLTIRGIEQTHVDDAHTRMVKEIKKLLFIEDWNDSPLRSHIATLTAEQKGKIKAEASAKDIEVEFKPDNIYINGAKQDVKYIHGYIDKILHAYIDTGPKLPADWNMAVMVDGYAEIVLDETKNDVEYKKVSSAFGNTLRRGHRITEIRRVQNAGAYKMYMPLRDVVSKKLKRQDRVESWPLWHGTDHNTVSKITKGKFDRGLSGKNATAYGAGCYFASAASYSASDTYSRPNASGEKVIILARVITGDYCPGNSSYRAAPYKPGSDEQYDSVVDNTSSPSMYIVFEDRAALAEYIIKFRLA